MSRWAIVRYRSATASMVGEGRDGTWLARQSRQPVPSRRLAKSRRKAPPVRKRAPQTRDEERTADVRGPGNQGETGADDPGDQQGEEEAAEVVAVARDSFGQDRRPPAPDHDGEGDQADEDRSLGAIGGASDHRPYDQQPASRPRSRRRSRQPRCCRRPRRWRRAMVVSVLMRRPLGTRLLVLRVEFGLAGRCRGDRVSARQAEQRAGDDRQPTEEAGHGDSPAASGERDGDHAGGRQRQFRQEDRQHGGSLPAPSAPGRPRSTL